MSPSALTATELKGHLAEQLGFLETSARLYDEGRESEAKRLATTIRVLVHDTDKSVSLLTLLQVKKQIEYGSTVMAPCTPGSTSFVGIGMHMSVKEGVPSLRYAANLFRPQRWLSFDDWWSNEVLIAGTQERICRRDAVLTLANKDGGAHVDPEPSDRVRRLLQADPMDWKLTTIEGSQRDILDQRQIEIDGRAWTIGLVVYSGGTSTEFDSERFAPVRAAVRQAAHELGSTIRERLGALLG